MSTQSALMSITAVIGLVGFTASICWHVVRPGYDWTDALVRSLFVALQCMLWGAVTTFVGMELAGFTFGGTK